MTLKLTKKEWKDCELGDIIQFGPDFKTSIVIHSKSQGKVIHGPLSRRSIGELVSSLLGADEDIEIKIKKVYSKQIDKSASISGKNLSPSVLHENENP